MSAELEAIERIESKAPVREGLRIANPRPLKAAERSALLEDIERASTRIAPLWPLQHFVAVNPYLGFLDHPFHEGLARVEQLLGARGAMSLADYQQALAAKQFESADLDTARKELARRARAISSHAEHGGFEAAGSIREASATESGSVAQIVDHLLGTTFESAISDHLASWCAGRFDTGQAAWPAPDASVPAFAAWKRHAWRDRDFGRWLPELGGFVATLPDDPVEAIETVLAKLDRDPAGRADHLTRLLASVYGWASHARYRQWSARLREQDDDTIVHLLAARAAYDGALALRHPPTELRVALEQNPIEETDTADPVLAEWQRAYELGRQRWLAGRLLDGTGAPRTTSRPALQAAFCIDVRSEVLRRHLEVQSSAIQTVGYAGFFGLPLEFQALGESAPTARCPALLAPPVRVEEASPGAAASGWDLAGRLEPLRKLSVAAFPFVELFGLGFGARLLPDGAGWSSPRAEGALLPARRKHPSDLVLRAERETRIELAAGLLRGMGLTEGFAPAVLLCGHGSRSVNNPFASSLDCGACGGHSGEANARVAAGLLNDAEVRQGLGELGIHVPGDTTFVAALHDTTTDEIQLLGASPEVDALRERFGGAFEVASQAARAERALRFRSPIGEASLESSEHRASDWSEVRPEWGLAGNAAFVAAPRALTRGVDLEGRVFLHDYEEANDPEGALLESILTAPMVVASWINLQYYASTVDNERLGSGDKTIHNVVGHLGVVCGNDADLRPGLPLQSVHDGERFVHEPVRLSAVIAAEPDALDRIIASHEDVRRLVEHEWIHLFAWRPEVDSLLKRGVSPGEWTVFESR